MIRRLFICILVFLLSLQVFGQQKTKEGDLSQKFQEWLKLTAFFILPQEKDVFLKLSSDIERDIFIESFWKQRDPTPGSPENEYREEMKKRFQYVNKEFRKGTPMEGWRTDMGRIYMILGPPKSRESITMPELQPLEVWTYYGDAAKGMPPFFGLIFFRREGIGELRLYDPAADGPRSLLKGLAIDYNAESLTEVYDKIKKLAPTAAPFTLSILPNEMGPGYQPSTFSGIQLAKILDSPRKDVNPAYATHFLNYRGIVSTDYLTNFVDSEAAVAVVRDPAEGIPILHFSITPRSLSIDYYEPRNQYYCNFAADVSLRKGDNIIYQYAKDFSYYFSPADSPMVTANGISIQDAFPVVDGRFKLTVLLRNTVGKEFCLLEKDVVIEGEESPRIAGPILGYKLETSGEATLMAFKVRDQRIFSDAKNTFSPSETITLLFGVENLTEDLWKTGSVRISVRGNRPSSPSTKSYTSRLDRLPYHKIVTLNQAIPASELTPDYYEVTLTLEAEGKVVDEAKANFIVSPAAALARPVIIAKAFPHSSFHLYYLDLAGQSEKIGDISRAQAFFEKALALAPDDPEALAYHAGFLLRSKKYEMALERVEKIKDDPTLRFDYFIIKGKALKELGRCEEAITCLLEGNKIYNSDTRLLNALGYCFYKTGQNQRALDALNASLKLNPDQAEAKALIEEIRKK